MLTLTTISITLQLHKSFNFLQQLVLSFFHNDLIILFLISSKYWRKKSKHNSIPIVLSLKVIFRLLQQTFHSHDWMQGMSPNVVFVVLFISHCCNFKFIIIFPHHAAMHCTHINIINNNFPCLNFNFMHHQGDGLISMWRRRNNAEKWLSGDSAHFMQFWHICVHVANID